MAQSINIPVCQSAMDAVMKYHKLECLQTTDTPHKHEDCIFHYQGAGWSVSVRNYFLVHRWYLLMLPPVAEGTSCLSVVSFIRTLFLFI